jgi:hypothetical protein
MNSPQNPPPARPECPAHSSASVFVLCQTRGGAIEPDVGLFIHGELKEWAVPGRASATVVGWWPVPEAGKPLDDAHARECVRIVGDLPPDVIAASPDGAVSDWFNAWGDCEARAIQPPLPNGWKIAHADWLQAPDGSERFIRRKDGRVDRLKVATVLGNYNETEHARMWGGR